VLEALLEKYRDESALNLDDVNILKVTPFSAMGSVVQPIKAFGGNEGFEKADCEMQDALYLESRALLWHSAGAERSPPPVARLQIRGRWKDMVMSLIELRVR
jgi:hypothetical protein